MTNDDDNDLGLNAYFAAGRDAAPQPSQALLARIVADAEAQEMLVVTPVRTGVLPSFWAAIGGWPAAAGLVTATFVGVWIGVYQPAGLDVLTDSYLGIGDDSYLVDLMPGFDDFLLEG